MSPLSYILLKLITEPKVLWIGNNNNKYRYIIENWHENYQFSSSNNIN